MRNFAFLLDFLSELAKNNTRPWFEEHRAEYQKAQEVFEKLVTDVISDLRAIEDLGDLRAKDCVMRIYRDVRFSKDKSPYRTHMGASIAAGGRKSPRLGYYLHLEPRNRSLIAGGLYAPEPVQLTRFREAISRQPAPFKAILDAPAFQGYFGSLQGERLKTAPKGFDPADPEIDLLRLKQVTAIHPLSDADILSAGLTGHIFQGFTALKPFLDYLNDTI